MRSKFCPFQVDPFCIEAVCVGKQTRSQKCFLRKKRRKNKIANVFPSIKKKKTMAENQPSVSISIKISRNIMWLSTSQFVTSNQYYQSNVKPTLITLYIALGKKKHSTCLTEVILTSNTRYALSLTMYNSIAKYTIVVPFFQVFLLILTFALLKRDSDISWLTPSVCWRSCSFNLSD